MAMTMESDPPALKAFIKVIVASPRQAPARSSPRNSFLERVGNGPRDIQEYL